MRALAGARRIRMALDPHFLRATVGDHTHGRTDDQCHGVAVPAVGDDHRAIAHCFTLVNRQLPRPGSVVDADVPEAIGQPLANLLPLLGCGEEAAALAFEGLSTAVVVDPVATAVLAAIASEERGHDASIRALLAALPPAPRLESMLTRARRFHIRLAAGGTTLHLARIAALDSAVCIILSRLTGKHGRLVGTPAIRGVLTRIRDDEARHVTASRRLVLAVGERTRVRDAAAVARDGLANILALASDAFEALAVDPTRLVADVRNLPNGLFPA